MSYNLMGESVQLSAERVKKVIEQHPHWKQRAPSRTSNRGQQEVFEVFTVVAKEKKLCPTNEEIALQIDASLSSVVMWIVRLRKANRIVTRSVLLSHNGRTYYRRVVRILGTPYRSAEPTLELVLNSRPGLAVNDKELDAAKVYMRQSAGKPVVYDSGVVDSRKVGLGLVTVGSREYSADQVIAMAKARGFVYCAPRSP